MLGYLGAGSGSIIASAAAVRSRRGRQDGPAAVSGKLKRGRTDEEQQAPEAVTEVPTAAAVAENRIIG